ncbi:MAG TPA: Ku protein, partial [Vicinamibacterales bacterium]|nr:Ku protein [Vicinamibacterales bacterium]
MAARPTWKGYLRVSLVSIPIRVFPATDPSATIGFHQLHRACRTRIQQKRWCPTCEEEVPLADVVKGYEFEKGRYVVIEEEDIAKVRPESTRVVNLVRFADADEIDPIYVERPYYVAPDGPVAAEAFVVMREGMKGKAGVGKLALYGREYIVAVVPREKGLVMFTLRQASEIRSMAAIEELRDLPEKVDPEQVKLARRVVETFAGKLDLREHRDEYQAALRELVERKIAGEEIVAPAEEAPPKVVNLMDALRRSLERVSAEKKRPARATAERRAARPAAR